MSGVRAPSGYDPDTLLVGFFGRPHGVRGELMVRAYNVQDESRSALDATETVIVEHSAGGAPASRRAYHVLNVRQVAGGWLMELEGIDSREAAAALTHAAVRVPRSSLPPLGPGEFFVEDVVGCDVRREDGRLLGRVGGLLWNGAQDVMVVAGDGREHLIPLVPAFLHSVDVTARQVVVVWEDDVDVDEGGQGG